jgi:hypothetical protein
MGRYLIQHRHEPHECGVAYASFKGHASPLRHRETVGSCLTGDHRIWWTLDAADREAALAQLPFFVAERSTATEIRDVLIP